MKLLVTGGAGFIGSNLVDKLIKEGYEVLVVDDLSSGKKEYINPKAKFYKRDIRNLKAIKPLFKSVGCVFHMAARARIQPSIINPAGSFENNVVGTFNVLLASRDAKIKKLVYSASSAAYGDQKKMPLKEDMPASIKNPYALFKYMGEEMAMLFHKMYSLPVVCLRYFNVYGERQSTDGPYATVIGRFLHLKSKGKSLTIVGDGAQRRDFTYVGDVVRANVLAMKSKRAVGHVVNIGNANNYSVNDVARIINAPHVFVPPRPGEARVTLADISKAKKLLGWAPKADLADWIKAVIRT